MLIYTPNTVDFVAVLPHLLLVVGSGLLLVAAASGSVIRRVQDELATLFIVSAAWTRLAFPLPGDCWSGALRIDGLSRFVEILILLALAISIWIGGAFLRTTGRLNREHHVLLMLSACGAMVATSSTDIMALFLGLELLFLPLVALVALADGSRISVESGLKIFMPGTIATMFMLYGGALVFAETGATRLAEIALVVETSSGLGMWGTLGFAALLGGLLHKAGVVPFHGWSIDVTQGSPAPVAGFFAVIPKIVALVVMFRLATAVNLADTAPRWACVVSVLAVASQFLGNVAALVQHDIKRMLAYCGVAQLGFVLVAVAVPETEIAGSALLVSIAAYTLMTMGAFAAVACLSETNGPMSPVSDLAGLGWRRPLPALALTICLLSWLALPPSIGFFARFAVFAAAVDSGLLWLVVVTAVNSLVTTACLLRIIVVLYCRPIPADSAAATGPRVLTVVTVCSALLVALAGFFPTPILSAARIAARHWVN